VEGEAWIVVTGRQAAEFAQGPRSIERGAEKVKRSDVREEETRDEAEGGGMHGGQILRDGSAERAYCGDVLKGWDE